MICKHERFSVSIKLPQITNEMHIYINWYVQGVSEVYIVTFIHYHVQIMIHHQRKYVCSETTFQSIVFSVYYICALS